MAGIATAGTGLGARIASSVHLWLSGGHVALRVSSFSGTRSPIASEFRAEIANATFPVVFPVGLPAGTRIAAIYASPLHRPSALFISYLNPRTGMKASFTLVDPADVETGRGLLAMTAGPHPAVYDWRTAGEVVFVGKDRISAADADRVKQAMAVSSPSSSLAATMPLLRTITVLGAAERIDIAEGHRTPGTSNVLLGADEVRAVPALAKRGAPMRDSRRFFVTSFPYVNGEPDYAKARGRNLQAPVVPPNGVRAIDAVLRWAGVATGDCACEVLFSRPNAAAYRVVVIPNAATAVRTYDVDARTLAVKPRS